MGFEVRLCHNNSPVDKIGKDLDAGNTITGCVLKKETSILRPKILLISEDPDITGYNYMEISEFGRYYFIDDIVSINNNKWEISGHVDVLQTYMSDILNQNVILNKQETRGNKYLNDGSFVSQVNEFNTSYNFPNGFNTSGTFILICAGG